MYVVIGGTALHISFIKPGTVIKGLAARFDSWAIPQGFDI
jgi:hypothetical protein